MEDRVVFTVVIYTYLYNTGAIRVKRWTTLFVARNI